jgi:hypothetical protein
MYHLNRWNLHRNKKEKGGIDARKANDFTTYRQDEKDVHNKLSEPDFMMVQHN